jgi:TetR/AcrR family transcriptional regulator, lmrAB and yxaGH operons repressor
VPSDTREQMIYTAARLFQRDGYHATSWRSLVEEAGTPWGSIHHHFPGGKDELGVAAIDAGSVGVIALIDHCFKGQPDAGRAVARWFELSGRLLVDSGYAAGCPVATVALETAANRGALHEATRAAFSAWEKRLSFHLRRAGASRASAADVGTSVLILLEGALLLSRTRGSLTPMRVASRHAQAIAADALTASSSSAA